MDHAAHAVAERGGHDVGRAAGVDLLEVVRPLGVDHARGVDDVDRAGEAGEERVQPVGSADVADDRLDAGEAGEGHQVLGVADEGANGPWSGVRAAVADEVVDQRPAQPAAGSRHDREVGRIDPVRPDGAGVGLLRGSRAVTVRSGAAVTA